MTNRKLFFTMLKLSAVTFGGGFVIIALMKEKLVETGDMDQARFSQVTTLAQSAPGPLAVNAAFLAGRELGGTKGALAAALGAVLPPLVILSIASAGYALIRDFPPIQSIMRFMRAAVAAIVLSVAADMAGARVKQRDIPALVFGGVGLVLLILGLHPALVIVAGAAYGVARAFLRRTMEKQA